MQKRINIILFYLLLLALFFGFIYFMTRPEMTCTDGIKNQGEEGIDCGGPCPICEEEYPGLTQIKNAKEFIPIIRINWNTIQNKKIISCILLTISLIIFILIILKSIKLLILKSRI